MRYLFEEFSKCYANDMRLTFLNYAITYRMKKVKAYFMDLTEAAYVARVVIKKKGAEKYLTEFLIN